MLKILLLLGCVVFDSLAFEYEDFDDQYSYEDDEESAMYPSIDSARVRRYDRDSGRGLQPHQKDIKGALNQIMSGRKMEDFIDEPINSKIESNQLENEYGSLTPAREAYDITTPTTKDFDSFSTINKEYDTVVTNSNDVKPMTSNDYDATEKTPNDYDIRPMTKSEDSLPTRKLHDKMIIEYDNVTPGTKMELYKTTLEWILQTGNTDEKEKQELLSYIQEMADERFRNEENKPTRIPTKTGNPMMPERSSQKNSAVRQGADLQPDLEGLPVASAPTETLKPTELETTIQAATTQAPTTEKQTTEEPTNGETEPASGLRTNPAESTTEYDNITTTTEKPKHTTMRTTVQFDIEKFLEIIANLTYDYETNLTMQVNETLKRMSVPTCGTPTTTTEATTTPTTGPPDYAAINKTLIGKCFVCGLEVEGIPYDANCADAFAGDFIPLVPQDPSAKGQIAKFRKYCRYQDVDNYVMNKTMPRSIFGRWTGGCSVRWTDLSGVYTQRSCRNRFHATTGRHFASKRMAKLEMALSSMDDGCIISPVATLLPLSRGISLFARFHACVCTGNWCNAAPRDSQLTAVTLTFLTAAIIPWLNEM